MKITKLFVLVLALLTVVSAFRLLSYLSPLKKMVEKISPNLMDVSIGETGVTLKGAVLLSGLIASIIITLAIAFEANRIGRRFSKELKEDIS